MPIVILVHGTWAPHAAWCSPESKVSDTLRATLGQQTIIDRFEWTGKNTHRARALAALALQERIRELQHQYPDDQQFLVAHSHGGNVCLYALREAEVHQCVRGVVTMSTPFIVCRHRDLGTSAFTAIGIFLIAALAWPVVLLCIHKFGSVIGRLISLGIVAIVIAAVIGLDFLVRKLIFNGKSHTEIYESWAKSLALPQLASDELLVVRSAGDEASGALAVGYIVAWALDALARMFGAIFKAGAWIAIINKRYSPARRATCAVGPLLVGSILLWFTVVDAVPNSCAVWRFCFFAGVGLTVVAIGFVRAFGYDGYEMIGFILQAFSGALILPVVVALMICMLPFGIDTAVFGLLFDLSAEASPPGVFTVLETAASTDRLLSHSAPYDDPDILKQIAGWISARVSTSSRVSGA